DSERNVMLSECTKEFDNIFKKIDPIISDLKKQVDNCVDPEPVPGTIAIPICSIIQNEYSLKNNLYLQLKKQKDAIEKCLIKPE
ncbi:hypothetical protein, partial [Clostridium sp. HBUAS56017]|uniref:hypothetical protein n=1 Tax=Clostridium sp. HBUAS56017 TaxID=2571128 RepID=UPI001A9AF7BB